MAPSMVNLVSEVVVDVFLVLIATFPSFFFFWNSHLVLESAWLMKCSKFNLGSYLFTS